MGRPRKPDHLKALELNVEVLLGANQAEHIDEDVAGCATINSRARLLRLCWASVRTGAADLGVSVEEYLREVFDADEMKQAGDVW